ncbi:MAG: YicC/YloC family endoribonuclease [Planctomycetota bacterium]
MLNSMTGYGEAQGQFQSATYIAEIRAVNNRYFKARIKLPDAVMFLEDKIETMLRQQLSRGMVTYILRLKDASQNELLEINEKILTGYIEKLKNISSSTKMEHSIDISDLLTLPGVLIPIEPDSNLAGNLKEFVLDLTQQALNRLKEMQDAEGNALVADLKGHCQQIREELEKISARSQVVLQEYHDKLKLRVETLLAASDVELDQPTVAREVSVFAEKSDIAEEIARLDSHISQFEQNCQADGQAGRRLDFLSQEMLREANTIASKCADTEIINSVIDIKCSIDRIKEQVQNVK